MQNGKTLVRKQGKSNFSPTRMQSCDFSVLQQCNLIMNWYGIIILIIKQLFTEVEVANGGYLPSVD